MRIKDGKIVDGAARRQGGVRESWNFANGHQPSCGVLWAQMPYVAEEGGATDAT